MTTGVRALANNLQTIIIAAVGGMLFSFVGIPIPWMLGSLTAILLWRKVTNTAVVLTPLLRDGALIVLGVVMGKSFSQEAALRVIDQLPIIVSATILTILFSLVMAYLVYRLSGISLPSAILGSIPGGLSQMVVLSEEVADAQVSVVTLMQTVRLLSVVFLVPFVVQKGLTPQTVAVLTPGTTVSTATGYLLVSLLLAVLGAVAATRLKLPTSYLLGPVLMVAVLVFAGFPPPQVPSGLIITAQLIMGASMGVNFQLEPGTRVKQLLFLSITSNLVIVLFTFGIGYLLTLLHNQSLVTSFLSMSPGGISEMGITAVAVGADLALVTSYQMFRLLFILLAVPPILRRLLKGIPKTGSAKT